MADKAISELVSAEQITATDMFVLEQNGTAKKLTGQILLNWLTKAADGHGGIASIEKLSTSGLADTYRITLADTTTFDFVVTNGRSVNTITKVSTSGLTDTYRISYNDNTTSTFTVTNGAKGDQGDNTYLWIKYASQKPTADSHSFGDLPDDWIGIYFGAMAEAPADWAEYTWFKIKGEKGETGDPATLVSSEIRYQVGDSGTIIPSGSWSENVPTVTSGKYLWTRQVIRFNTGAPITSYSVSRFGIDGSGAVVAVAGVAPEPDGNVPLDASHIKALSLSGGTMEGSINMNGQELSGLNAPKEDDEAATKGFVDNAVKKVAPYNYVDNSDFTQFVAQGGVGDNHGNQAYAGDRWILDNGTVTGDAREDGNGYTNITLNGTIRQIVANPPEVGTAAIEMISGIAEITYADGEITITSDGGIIKNVALYCSAENMPVYHSKGYSAEYLECARYYTKVTLHRPTVSFLTVSKFLVNVTVPVVMRIRPTIKLDTYSIENLRINGESISIDLGPSEAQIYEYRDETTIPVTVEFEPSLGSTDKIYEPAYVRDFFTLEFSADL